MNISLENIQTIINGLKEYIGDRLNILNKELKIVKKDIKKNKSTAYNAQSTANAAQSTAYNAQSTAYNAQHKANDTRSTINKFVISGRTYSGKVLSLNNNKVYQLEFTEYDKKLIGHNVYICGHNLFNMYGNVNTDASTGEERLGYNVVSNGVLTANLYSDDYKPNGQKFTFLKGEIVSFGATCIEGYGYIGIYENGVESKFVTGQGKLTIRGYTVQSDNAVFVLHTVGSVGGAKFTEIQLEIGGPSYYQDYKAFCVPMSSPYITHNTYITTKYHTVIYNDQDAFMKVTMYDDINIRSPLDKVNVFNLPSASHLFYECEALKVPKVSSEDLDSAFQSSSLHECYISSDVYKPKNIKFAFAYAYNLQMIDGCLDLKNIPMGDRINVNTTGAFLRCNNLSHIESIINIKSSLDFSSCPLNARTVDMLLSNLLPVNNSTTTLSFRSDIVDRLTDEQLAKVPAGWIIQ